MIKYAPGPWKWVPEKDYPITYLYGANPKDEYDYILAIYESHGGGHMPDEAHARLIAASSDLLRACEDLLTCQCNVPVGEHCWHVKQAEATITRVKRRR